MERRGNRFGTLIFKGEGKPWLAKWVACGKVYYKSTGETDKKKALKVLEKLTRPYREEDEAAIIENLEMMLKRAKANARGFKKLEVDNLWSEFKKTLWEGDVEEGTARVYEGGIYHLQGWLCGKVNHIAEVDSKLAERYLKELSNTIGAATYNTRLSLFKRVWHHLPEEYGIDKTVWDEFKKKKGATGARRTLSSKELAKLFASAETHDMKLLLSIGTYTGLRLGDCAMLKWADIDFEHNIIRVVPMKTRKHMDGPIEIPMHSVLVSSLKTAVHDSEYVSKANAASYMAGKLSGEVVNLFKSCGIETSVKDANGKTKIICSFHSLRHTFVSMAINSGMSPLLVQRVVGHSTVDMTSAYFHENMDKMTDGINALPAVI